VAHLYRPQEKLSLIDWSIKHRGYDPETLPWQNELRNALGDPATSEVGIIKPVQCGATTIGADWTGWLIDTDPSDMLICQPDRLMAEKFVKGRLDPMIDSTWTVKSKLQPLTNANNQWIKLFRGMMLTTVWPVPAQFTQLSVRYGWLDDFDQYDDNIGESGGEGGQGSAITLLDGRFTAHEGREKKYISSSPAKDDGGGIEAFVESGTDERLQPECPSCGERFEIDFLRDLKFDDKGTADQAEKTAHVLCPVNGCILEPSDRRKLHESCMRLPDFGFVQTNHGMSRRRRTFRVDGLMALPTWPTLARVWREAQIAWATRQDESGLRTVVNTKAGKNYRSKHSGEKPLDGDALAKRLEGGWRSGEIPAGAKVVVVAVDVQNDRFEVLVIAYGENLESWIIDRYPIDVLPDGLTTVKPFRHPEHWQVLLPLFTKQWPLADGSGRAVPALTVAIDTGGSDTAGDDSALKFWHAARALGVHPSRITLLKGASRPTGPLISQAQFSDRKVGGGARKAGPKLFHPNVHAIKHIIDSRLRRMTSGPGYIHLPGWIAPRIGGQNGVRDHSYLDEMTCERLEKGKWKKERPRNETWDLLVYSYAALLRPPFAQSRAHMRWVPADFRVPDFEMPTDDDAPAEVPVPQPAPRKVAQPAKKPAGKPAKPRVNKFTGRSGGWINRK
jgi:phage terminase large subunit GpA-like protein